jgi:hypothetical protein
MKYIIENPKGAHIYKADVKGTVKRTGGFRMPKEIIEGELTKAQTPSGSVLVTRAFVRYKAGVNEGVLYVLKNDVTPVANKAEANSFSGAEVVAKFDGVDVLIPVGIFGGLGFVIGSIIGENKLQLAISGAAIGGLIGSTMKGENFSGVDGRGKGSLKPFNKKNICSGGWDASDCIDSGHSKSGCCNAHAGGYV